MAYRKYQQAPPDDATIQRKTLMSLRHLGRMSSAQEIKAGLTISVTMGELKKQLAVLRRAGLVDAYPAVGGFKLTEAGRKAIEGL